MQDRLVFVIGSPRSGSTLLARMLDAHSEMGAPAEPHLLTPLAHLGYFENVERAAYDPVITRGAIRELVASLPRGEESYLEALRAYTDSIYRQLLEQTGARRLVDKTPAYALVLDFVARLYPKARYVVLTRHPMAIWTSFVNSFFDGDDEAAHRHNPLLERYVPAIARFLREQPVPIHHVRYEELVADPATHLERICDFLDLSFEPGMVDYGAQDATRPQVGAGLGDPITVSKETRPTTRSVAKWAEDLAGNPEAIARCRRILATLLDEDLVTWGFARAEISAQLEAIEPGGIRAKRSRLTGYTAWRKLLVLLRRNIHHNAFGRLVRRVRTVCDVLLR